jgi:hypothetical protein
MTDVHKADNIETHEVECWHLEYCSFDPGQMAWRPMILTLATKDACESQIAAWQSVKSICCCRVMGPRFHVVPKEV